MNYIKYPRTFHLPWSEGVSSDDKILKNHKFEGKEVVVTEKMDGENATMYHDYIHARSLSSLGGEERAWVKQYWATIRHEIPKGWRICGENLWAKHSIAYNCLKSFFYGFSIWNDENFCISWKDANDYFSILGITPVPVLYVGIWNEKLIRELSNQMDLNKSEGYVVRLADSFHYNNFSTSVAKYVRKNHVQTDKHWSQAQFIPNVMDNP